jgi:hypothetical protein
VIRRPAPRPRWPCCSTSTRATSDVLIQKSRTRADGSQSWVQVGSGVERGGQEAGPIADRT